MDTYFPHMPNIARLGITTKFRLWQSVEGSHKKEQGRDSEYISSSYILQSVSILIVSLPQWSPNYAVRLQSKWSVSVIESLMCSCVHVHVLMPPFH